MTQRQVSRDGQVTPTRAPVPTGRNCSATGGLTSKVVRMISKRTLISIVIFACGAFGLVGSLAWASARFDALDSGAQGAPSDALGVASIFVFLALLGIGLILLIRVIADTKPRHAEG